MGLEISEFIEHLWEELSPWSYLPRPRLVVLRVKLLRKKRHDSAVYNLIQSEKYKIEIFSIKDQNQIN